MEMEMEEGWDIDEWCWMAEWVIAPDGLIGRRSHGRPVAGSPALRWCPPTSLFHPFLQRKPRCMLRSTALVLPLHFIVNVDGLSSVLGKRPQSG